jgi:mRNA-degrading endonuclease toxin of MazEF toxin-antitoxin module
VISRQTYPSILPGDILLVDLNQRVGHEFSGVHFVIALHHSSPQNSTVVVVPLSSYKARALRQDELFVGQVLYWSGQDSVAKVGQIVCVAKERILRHRGTVGISVLNKIRQKVIDTVVAA